MSRINISDNQLIIKGAKTDKNPVMAVCLTLGMLSFLGFFILAISQQIRGGVVSDNLWSLSQVMIGFAILVMLIPVFVGPDIIFDKKNGFVKTIILGFPVNTLCSMDDISNITAKSSEKIYRGKYTSGTYWTREINIQLKNGFSVPVTSGTDFNEINYIVEELSKFLGIAGEDVTSSSKETIRFAPAVDGDIIAAPQGIMENRTITAQTPFYDKPVYEGRYNAAQVGAQYDMVNISEEKDGYGIYVTPSNKFRSITGGAKYLTGCSFIYMPIMILAAWAALNDKRHPPMETFTDPGFLGFIVVGFIIVFFAFKAIKEKMGKPMSFRIDRNNLTIETAGNAPVVLELDSINDISAEMSGEMEAFLVIRQGNQAVSISNSLTILTCEQIYREIHRMAKELKNRSN